MRLKKLTLQAFGPFKDKVVIDFENENINNGLLLISGDTGAGKTTIFDAICYALYGEASGDAKEANSLRSDWASPDVETFVDLEFYYKDKFYEVRRTPKYFRPKKYGEGLTEQAATAELDLGNRVVTKVNDVKAEVEELIGLEYDQFRQVAMLSQGEFTKFLLAEPDEKTTIFRKIFDTGFYERLQSELKEKENSKHREVKEVMGKIDTEKENLESIINLFGKNNDETILELNNKIKKDTEKVEKTKNARDEKEKEKTKLFNELENQKKLNDNIITYQKASKNLGALLSSNPDIEDEREKYNYNIIIANPIFNALNGIEKATESLEENKTKCLQSKKCLKVKKEKYEEKEEVFKKLDNCPREVEKLTNEINDLVKKDEDYEDYLIKVGQRDRAKEKYKGIVEIYEEKNAYYEIVRKEYYLNASVEIAETLVEGEECPVCGSKEHPKKAISTQSKCTKEDVQNAEKDLKEAEGLRKKCEARIEEMNKAIEEYNIPEDLDVESERNEIAELVKEKKEKRQKVNDKYTELSKEKQDLCAEIRSNEDNIGIFAGEIKKLKKSICDYHSALDKLYKENNTDYEDYLSKKLDENELSSLKDKIEIFDKKKTEFESIIELLEEEVKGKEVVDVSEKEELLISVTKEYEDLDKEYTDLSSTLQKLIESADRIEKYIESFNQIESEYKVIKVLSATANGTLTGKQKISFERYVQSYYMENVLIEANNRFDKMTDGRYELRRKEDETNLSVKAGLDFTVFDEYTQKERDVSSLSGGEKFKASLALALGLSDVISNNRGGIKIESLFIDEGFGSLDSESLDQALNTLYDLSGNEKLIGVISHVNELKTRIDNKILVNKSSTGSGISIETNV